MSTTYSTQDMVNELQTRLPYGFSNTFLMNRLNIAYMWLKQKANYKADMQVATVSTSGGTTPSGPLPLDFDAGSEASLVSGTGLVPYCVFDDFVIQKNMTSAQPTGLFGAWTFYGTTSPLTFEVTPFSMVGVVAFQLLYHRIGTTRLSVGPATYFPTPDAFDTLIMLRAEADTRFMYDLGGSDSLYRMSEEDAKNLVDRYRSTKKDMAGMVDQIRQAQEFTAQKSFTG